MIIDLDYPNHHHRHHQHLHHQQHHHPNHHHRPHQHLHHNHRHDLEILDSLIHVTDTAVLPLDAEVHGQCDRRLFVTHLCKLT